MATATKHSLRTPVSVQQWEEIEEYYLAGINQIHIPEDPKPYDITSINSQLEKLFHEARLDFYYAKKAQDKIDSAYSKLKRALYDIVKVGKNQEERDSLLQEHLMLTTLDVLPQKVLQVLSIPPVKKTVYEVSETYKDRTEFLKTILDMISDKSSRLITDSGAMKIESSFGR